MFELRSREPVVLAENFDALVTWYQEALEFSVQSQHTEGFHYATMENSAGVRLGIASAREMGVEPHDRTHASVVLQFEVDDVPAFLEHVGASGGTIASGPLRNERDGFWFGSFADPEGNSCWVVDRNCPQ
ncbi:MAG: VOC family protein [Acidobacteriota bacterium]